MKSSFSGSAVFAWVHDRKVVLGVHERASGSFLAARSFCRSRQNASNLELKSKVRKFKTQLAPVSDQNIPDCLSRLPMTVLQPASTTPVPINQPFRRYVPYFIRILCPHKKSMCSSA